MAVVISEVEVVPDNRRPDTASSPKQDDAPAAKKPDMNPWQVMKQFAAREERVRAH